MENIGFINGYYLSNINGKEFVYSESEFETLMSLSSEYNRKAHQQILILDLVRNASGSEYFVYRYASNEKALELAIALEDALKDINKYSSLLKAILR